jgi:DNA-binding response OmpR family regulator
MSNILVIEDDADLAEIIDLHLRDNGHQVLVSNDGLCGYDIASAQSFDLILLDLGLPNMDGIEICRKLRQNDELTPVLMLTARDSELDRVLGLEMGADDYLVKPFSIRELQARIKAILRRQQLLQRMKNTATGPIAFRELEINPAKRLVNVRTQAVELTAKEFDLLLFLTAHPGQVYSREQLLDSVWGYSSGYFEHTINSNINRLRNKIERSPSAPEYILTVRGVGYKFNDKVAD